VTPIDLGMNWILSKTKDYLGRRSLERADCVREGRKELVGLLTKDPQQVLPEVKHSIAMALVKGGHQRHGETVYIALSDGRFIPATIGSSVFYDPKGERQDG